ncbi:methyltransferase TYW3 family protein [Nitzschia inconspicua]|uniref:Methyltransferase TYW3 family protein n=1 Tax=Nitzschia inconspicua TaxID=303405 RepID=A0A9K3LZ40_9STRA|nr:methyltransferase TYW3 family protein [Nitzschia inconspicua]
MDPIKVHSDSETDCRPISHGHLPLHWLQANLPQEHSNCNNILPSFADLQRKTWETLYGVSPPTAKTVGSNPSCIRRDKSPKGSVDAPIQHLVDLINHHSHYCTLSSCSGRLSLFDPNGSNVERVEMGDGDPSLSTSIGGKGRGGWVLVSHKSLSPHALVDALFQENGTNVQSLHRTSLQPWTFKFEPMLLHVAAASLQHGQQMLRLALDSGFRESGLVVTNTRVTVAIRSHSLALAVPLCPSSLSEPFTAGTQISSLQAPPAFLRALVQEGNQRLSSNWNLMERLYSAIESNLFQIQMVPPPIRIRQLQSPASLNLWNATAVSKKPSCNQDETSVEVWTAGGYGCGPISTTPRRSSKMYKLTLSSSSWSDQWGEIRTCDDSSSTDQRFKIFMPSHSKERREITAVEGYLRVESVLEPTESQSMASCYIQSIDCILLWGGRSGPKKPSDTLYLFDTQKERLLKVCDVRGQELPRPRWGHALVALDCSNRVVMLGGCNGTDGAMDDIFVLHICHESSNDKVFKKSSSFYFHWEKLSTVLPSPRFHFGTSLLQDNVVLVVGGLDSTDQLLPTMLHSQSCSTARVVAFTIGNLRFAGDATFNTECSMVDTLLLDENVQDSTNDNLGLCFGLSCCTLLKKHLLLTTGGVPIFHDPLSSSPSHEPILVHWVYHRPSSNLPLRIQRIPWAFVPSMVNQGGMSHDFGSVVHHSCVPVSDDSVLLVGGGVPSFSFGEEYASSYHLQIDITDDKQASDWGPTCLAEGIQESFQNAGTTQTRHMDSESSMVIYVEPKNAKHVKTLLLKQGWLDKRLRMTKCILEDDVTCIALPITVSHSLVKERFREWIIGEGEEDLHYSTGQYARKGRSK